MKNFTKSLTLALVLFTGVFLSPTTSAQSVMDPADPLVTWTPTGPQPQQPAWGTIGKWVRKQMMSWNTENYKSYIYKGMPFRLHFPKTYSATAADGKKYPLLLFFHGLGEADTNIHHNEFQLLLGHYTWDQQIMGGQYDGYILSISSPGSFGPTEFQKLKELTDYMIANNKVDPFLIATNGLSAGGQGAWEMAIAYPQLISAALPMSWASNYYTDPTIRGNLIATPIWLFHGGLDGNPAPYTVNQIKQNYRSVGANFWNSMYPLADHNSWDRAWQEPDFFGFIRRSYKSNPWPLFGKFDFWPGETINTTLALTPGMQAYQWRKNGVLISGATTNTLAVNSAGIYDARVQRDGIWSEWSRIPVTIGTKTYVSFPVKLEAENYNYMFGVNKEGTSDAGYGQNVGWIDFGDYMDFNINAAAAGTYTFKARVASAQTGGKLQLYLEDGTLLDSLTVPNTGGWQTWTTITGTATVPAGFHTLRLQAAGTQGWNVNWIDFAPLGAVNEAPTSNAGNDQTITLPANSATLTGSGTDLDGNIVSYAWTKVSGPAGGTISSPTTASTNVTSLQQGTYVFRLTVKDDKNATGVDDVTITVNAAVVNPTNRIQAETWNAMSGVQTENTADAGGGQNVGWIDFGDWMDYAISPSSAGTYTLHFRIASPNTNAQFKVYNSTGTVLATVNVPNTGGWQNWQTITAPVNLAAGSQIIRLQSSGGSGWNINWIEYYAGGTAPPNTPPTVNAGTDQTITLPTNATTLTGTASDADGTIATRAWTRVSGPNTPTFSSPSALSTNVSGLIAGTYVFRLTVTDNSGASVNDDVSVVVNPSNTTPPPPSTGVRIQAENFSAMSGIQTENTGDVGGGLNVGWVDPGDWMEYVINPANTGSHTMSFRVASQWNGGEIQVRRPNGTVIGTVITPATGGWQTYTTVTIPVTLTAGVQTIRLVSMNTSSMNINWIEIAFTGGASRSADGETSVDVSVQAPTQQLPTTMAPLSIYPNPVRDQLVIEVGNEHTGMMNVDLVDISGKIARQYRLQKIGNLYRNSINVSGLKAGIYHLRLRVGNWTETRRIQKF